MTKSTVINRAISFLITLTLIFGLCLMIPFTANAESDDPKLDWIKNHGGTKDDYLGDVIKTSDGGYVVIGMSTSTEGAVSDLPGNKGNSDFVIAKFDSEGNKVWIKNYGGTKADVFHSVVEAPGGGYVAVGYSTSTEGAVSDLPGNKGNNDFVIAKFDNNGEKVWIKSYGGTKDDYLYSVVNAPGGGYVAVGSSRSTPGGISDVPGNKGNTDFIIAKFDEDGNKVAFRNYGGIKEDFLFSVVTAPGGGYVAAGFSSSTPGGISDVPGNKGSYDFVITKFDESLNKLWVKNYGGNADDRFESVINAPGGGYIAAGYSYSGSSVDSDLPWNRGGSDFVIGKFDEDGNKVWIKSYGGNVHDQLLSVVNAPGGGFVAVGNSNSIAGTDSDLPGNKGNNDFVIVKFDNDGNKIWINNYGGSKFDYLLSLVQAHGNGFVAVGHSNSPDGIISPSGLVSDLPGNKGGYDSIIAKFSDSDMAAPVEESYKVTFNVNGGKALKTISKMVTANGKYGILPTPARTGYTFTGWYTAKTGGSKITTNTTVTITGDATFYAHWKAKSYKVVFVNSKGKQIKTKTVVYNKKYGKLPTTKAPGKKFAGWYTKKSGGKKITSKSVVKITKKTKLYPHWKKK